MAVKIFRPTSVEFRLALPWHILVGLFFLPWRFLVGFIFQRTLLWRLRVGLIKPIGINRWYEWCKRGERVASGSGGGISPWQITVPPISTIKALYYFHELELKRLSAPAKESTCPTKHRKTAIR